MPSLAQSGASTLTYMCVYVCVRCCLCDRKRKAPKLHIQAWLSVNESRAEINLHSCVMLDCAPDMDQHNGGGHGWEPARAGGHHTYNILVCVRCLRYRNTNTDTGVMTSHER